jgi:hypothetical protein
MKLSIVPALLATLLALVGCTNSYRIERGPDAAKQVQPLIAKGERVLVTIPQDGAYGATKYDGSGLSTQQAVVASLSGLGANAIPGERCDDPDVAAAMGKKANAQWVVYTRIHQWEDRATEWSGLPDRIRIEVRTISLPSGAPRDITIVEGSSKWATFGGDRPQDMLLPALKPWADSTIKR